MKSKTSRKRLDILLVDRGLAESQQKAQAMILAGEVSINGVAVLKAGTSIASDAKIEVKSRHLKYASRGGLKIEGALQAFGINPDGLVCLDVAFLHRVASRIAYRNSRTSLRRRCKHRPTRLESSNKIRALPPSNTTRATLSPDDIPEQVDLVVADVSFISVYKILGPASACAKPCANFLILVKPQFELPRDDVGPGGIVEDVRLHEKAIANVRKCSETAGLTCVKVTPSRLTGAEGNQEYFLHARKGLLK
jgi:23S rRNA (cytidine1920-2'-O)/16S rRNA (cytidine1409-2'-O)-methyltransferase